MSKHAVIILLSLLPAFAFGQNNIKKTAAVPYTQGVPTWTPNVNGSSEICIDTIASKLYWWSRNAGAWVLFPRGIDVITGTSAPAYTPRDNQSVFAINADSPPELYYHTGASWVQINSGGASDGNGVYGGSDTIPDGTVATLEDDFEIAGPDISSVTITTGATRGGQLFSNFQGATISRRDTSGDNSVQTNGNGITLSPNGGTTDRVFFDVRDARYSADYSASYSARSLIDKGYADATYQGIFTADNGLTKNTSTNVQLGGTLTGHINFAQAGFTINHSHASADVDPLVRYSLPSTSGFFGTWLINNDSLRLLYSSGAFRFNAYSSPMVFSAEGGNFSLESDAKVLIEGPSDVSINSEGGNVVIGGAASASELHFLEPSGSGTNYTALKAGAQSSSVTLTLPTDTPSDGDVLGWHTGNILSWDTPTGSASETNAPPVLYPSQITATQNDYSPTGYSTTVSQVIQVDGDGSFQTITGLSAATRNGVEKTFDNDGTNCYLIAKQHTGSSAANRFDSPKDVVMLPGMQATFRYDSVGQR